MPLDATEPARVAAGPLAAGLVEGATALAEVFAGTAFGPKKRNMRRAN